jgi:FixJ family two-component response regulator
VGVPVRCIGLSLRFMSELCRLDGPGEFRFLAWDDELGRQENMLRHGSQPAVVLASVETLEPAKEEALLELPRRLWRDGQLTAVILAGPENLADRAWRAGATDFACLPITAAQLLRRLQTVRRRLASLQPLWSEAQQARRRIERLTRRERQVLEYLAAGWWVKRIAAELGTSPNTVRNQRATVMDKLQAESDAEIFAILHAARWGQALGTFLAGDE